MKLLPLLALATLSLPLLSEATDPPDGYTSESDYEELEYIGALICPQDRPIAWCPEVKSRMLLPGQTMEELAMEGWYINIDQGEPFDDCHHYNAMCCNHVEQNPLRAYDCKIALWTSSAVGKKPPYKKRPNVKHCRKWYNGYCIGYKAIL